MTEEKVSGVTQDKVSRKFLTKSTLCGAAIVTSIVLSFIMLSRGENPTTDPFSAIGEQNRVLFLLWGIFTALAVYFNLRLLASRCNFKNKLFEIPLTIGCLMGILTTIIVGMETWQRIIHVGSAMLFGVLCVICVVWILIVKFMRKKKKRVFVPYVTALFIVAVIFIFASAQMGWFTALTQILLANVCLIIMFCSNFFEKWPDYTMHLRVDTAAVEDDKSCENCEPCSDCKN
ncbi:MAG: hypothetical protein FWE45_00310 [Firmicutes bacterium]|nr:hypothetical protein [Bacillota bacterium]